MQEVSTGRKVGATSCGSPCNKRGAIKDGHVFDVIRASGLSNSHWSVFNLQDLPGSEELTGTVLKHYLSHFLIYYLI